MDLNKIRSGIGGRGATEGQYWGAQFCTLPCIGGGGALPCYGSVLYFAMASSNPEQITSTNQLPIPN